MHRADKIQYELNHAHMMSLWYLFAHILVFAFLVGERKHCEYFLPCGNTHSVTHSKFCFKGDSGICHDKVWSEMNAQNHTIFGRWCFEYLRFILVLILCSIYLFMHCTLLLFIISLSLCLFCWPFFPLMTNKMRTRYKNYAALLIIWAKMNVRNIMN